MKKLKIRIIDDWDHNTNGAIKHDGEKGVERIDLLVAGEIVGWEDMQELITSLQLIQGRLIKKINSCFNALHKPLSFFEIRDNKAGRTHIACKDINEACDVFENDKKILSIMPYSYDKDDEICTSMIRINNAVLVKSEGGFIQLNEGMYISKTFCSDIGIDPKNLAYAVTKK